MGSDITPSSRAFLSGLRESLSKGLHRLSRSLFALSPQLPFAFIIARDDQHALFIWGAHPQDWAKPEAHARNRTQKLWEVAAPRRTHSLPLYSAPGWDNLEMLLPSQYRCGTLYPWGGSASSTACYPPFPALLSISVISPVSTPIPLISLVSSDWEWHLPFLLYFQKFLSFWLLKPFTGTPPYLTDCVAQPSQHR